MFYFDYLSTMKEKLKTHKNRTSFIDRFKIVASDLKYSQTEQDNISEMTKTKRLFTGLEVQPVLHSPTLFYSTYADSKNLS